MKKLFVISSCLLTYAVLPVAAAENVARCHASMNDGSRMAAPYARNQNACFEAIKQCSRDLSIGIATTFYESNAFTIMPPAGKSLHICRSSGRQKTNNPKNGSSNEAKPSPKPKTPKSQNKRKTIFERLGARISLHYDCKYPADVQIYYTHKDGTFRKAPVVHARPKHSMKLDESVISKSKIIYIYGQIRGDGPPNTYVYEWAGDSGDSSSRMLQFKGTSRLFRPVKMSYGGGNWLTFELNCEGLLLPGSFPYWKYKPKEGGRNSAPRKGTQRNNQEPRIEDGDSCRGRGC